MSASSFFLSMRVETCFVSTRVCATAKGYVYLRDRDGAAFQNGRVMAREMRAFSNMQLESQI
jgi:hypothetical protein